MTNSGPLLVIFDGSNERKSKCLIQVAFTTCSVTASSRRLNVRRISRLNILPNGIRCLFCGQDLPEERIIISQGFWASKITWKGALYVVIVKGNSLYSSSPRAGDLTEYSYQNGAGSYLGLTTPL